MDVEAIARRIAQDHGVTVLEKDVIETLEKLKAQNKDKTTGAGEAQVTPQKPEVSPITSASNTQKVAEQPPAPLPTGTEQPSAPLQAGSAPQPTVPAPLAAGSGAAPAGLPTDLPSILSAFQQFLAAYKQAPNSVPAASEQVNESDSSHMIPISG
ncbi:MAG: hypothetical protein ABSD41_05185 [Candidatus Bathyarchaeia archaeon]|jgi:hypothetical protein